MLVDEAVVTLKGGDGGPGKVSFYNPPMKGPDGGNGGRGGGVIIEATTDLTALGKFMSKKFLTAQNGDAGGKNRKFGHAGADLIVQMPVGTVLEDNENGNVFELVSAGQQILVCRGGLGGKGNFEFKSPTNTTPKYAQPGTKGEEKTFEIHLKLIADFGLIGLPNSGKSSLLNELTNAKAKVGDYSFTTLEPNLGMIDGKVIADIPGLIEGASSGKGLGIKFLKHIEKVGLLFHCISVESEHPEMDYKVVRNELEKYNPEILDKKEIILLTKTDLASEDDFKKKFGEIKKLNSNVFGVSIYDFDSLEKFRKKILSRGASGDIN